MEKDHSEYITSRADHALVLQSLPKKLTLREFAYRILLMAFHWVAKTGTEPTFWKALEKKKLLSCLPDFAGSLTMKIARNVFELRGDGKLLMPDAMNKSIDKCKAEHYHGIEEWSLGPAQTAIHTFLSAVHRLNDADRKLFIEKITTTIQVNVIDTVPISGQKPGTSGVRKKVSLVESTPFFVENIVQSTFNTEYVWCRDTSVLDTLVVGGDGRSFTIHALQIIIKIAAGNGVRRVIVGQNGLLSTPALSSMIRSNPRVFGGFILTASHNPGGPDGDFGIKYNIESGAPAPESLTSSIHEETMRIKQIRMGELPGIDVSIAHEEVFFRGSFSVDVVDPVDEEIPRHHEIGLFEQEGVILEDGYDEEEVGAENGDDGKEHEEVMDILHSLLADPTRMSHTKEALRLLEMKGVSSSSSQ